MSKVHLDPVVERMNRYLDGLLDRAAQKIAPRVADRLAAEIGPQLREEYESWLATIEVMADPALVADLRASGDEDDEAAEDYEEVRRELGLA